MKLNRRIKTYIAFALIVIIFGIFIHHFHDHLDHIEKDTSPCIEVQKFIASKGNKVIHFFKVAIYTNGHQISTPTTTITHHYNNYYTHNQWIIDLASLRAPPQYL